MASILSGLGLALWAPPVAPSSSPDSTDNDSVTQKNREIESLRAELDQGNAEKQELKLRLETMERQEQALEQYRKELVDDKEAEINDLRAIIVALSNGQGKPEGVNELKKEIKNLKAHVSTLMKRENMLRKELETMRLEGAGKTQDGPTDDVGKWKNEAQHISILQLRNQALTDQLNALQSQLWEGGVKDEKASLI